MNNILFLCNTVYQVMVASWIRKTEFNDDYADIIISDHMNNYDEIADKIESTNFFNTVYKAKTKKFINVHVDYSMRARLKRGIHPQEEIETLKQISKKYDVLILANLDLFSQRLYNVLKNRRFSKYGNSNLKLYIYEDGIMTYSKLFERYYKDCKPEIDTIKLKIFNKYILNNRYIYGNVSGLFLFNKELIQYTPDCPVSQISKIDYKDKDFCNYLNYIFAYSSKDVYDKKVIFLEESIYMDNDERPDADLLDQISKEIGKDNIMVKIHPRNPQNIFLQKGYKTNENTAIPWELILLNNNFSDKVLVTIASSAILNPVTILGIKIKSYSLYECLREKPSILSGDFWECVRYQYEHYDNIKVFNDLRTVIDEIRKDMKNEN